MMKRVIFIVLIGCTALWSNSFYATAQERSRTLVVYFSESGNTRNMANIISELSGADLVEIEMQHPYSDDYSTLLDEAERDLIANARPPLRTRIDNMDEYDTVLVGYPNWYAILPSLFIRSSNLTILAGSGLFHFAAMAMECWEKQWQIFANRVPERMCVRHYRLLTVEALLYGMKSKFGWLDMIC